MANTSRVVIQETYSLPSRGKCPGVPETITLRAMSLLDEKKRLASQSFTGIVDLIGDCIVSPEGVDPYKMSRFDVDYAMLKLRVVSHGPMYSVEVTCPHCGKTNKEEINLDEIPTIEVPDEFQPVFEIGPLPLSGDVLKVKIMTYEDMVRVDEEARRVLAKFPEYEGDPSEILNYIYKIVEVNEETLSYPHLKQYVESMSANDSIYFDQAYSDMLGQYGPDTRLSFTCPHCREGYVRYMPMNAEFFRPRFDVAKRADV